MARADPGAGVGAQREGSRLGEADPAGSSPPWGRPSAAADARRTVLLVVTATAATAVALHHLVVPGVPPVEAPATVPALVLLLAFFVAETMVVHLRLGRSASTVSLSELPMVVGLFFAGPQTLVATRVLGGGLALLWHRRQRAEKFAFNLALFALEAVVAVAVWHAVLAGHSPFGPRGWLASLVAMATVDLLGSGLVALTIAVSEREPLLPTLRQVTGWGPAAALVNTTCGLVLIDVLVVDWRGVWAVAVLVGVVFLAHRAYMTLQQRHERLERLNRFTGEVGRQLELDAVSRDVLRQLCQQLEADRAELLLDERFAGRPVHLAVAGGDVVSTPDGRSLAELLRPHPGAPVLLPRTDRDPRVRALLQLAGARDAMSAVLLDEDGVAGRLVVADRIGDVSTFAADDLTVLEALANHASVALRNARLADRLRRQAEASERQALRDPLTGLANRVLFRRRLDALTAEPGATGAILLLDLDRFKDVNDTLGHQTGDRLLCDVGARLAAWAPPGALVARLGGDEFGVLLTGASPREAVGVARELVAALLQPFDISGMRLAVDASIGVAAAPWHGSDGESLLRRADVAMYTAKEVGTGVELYDPDQDRLDVERLTLVTDLRTAIAAGALDVVFQPKASLCDRRVGGVEALVRWDHPTRGAIPPDEFIPVAEHTGLIEPLTDFVVARALAQVRAWRDAGADLTVAVNLSMRSLRDVGFPQRLRSMLAQACVPPQALVLEITESVLMSDPDRTLHVLDRLSALEVGLSIDDLGTGHSSLAYLKRLPVDEVKIDRSFVTGITAGADDAAIVGTIVQLGHRLGKRVVAEGVEDERAWRALRGLGCDLAQGFWICRPRPAEQVLPWLRHEWTTARDPDPRALAT